MNSSSSDKLGAKTPYGIGHYSEFIGSYHVVLLFMDMLQEVTFASCGTHNRS
jgi:hypothetical protein